MLQILINLIDRLSIVCLISIGEVYNVQGQIDKQYTM